LLLSANLLSSLLFACLGVKRPPLTFHYTRAVHRRFAVFSHLLLDHKGHAYPLDALSPSDRLLRQDYGLLKYDILAGQRFLLRYSGPQLKLERTLSPFIR